MFIKFVCLIKSFRHLDAELVGTLPVPRLDFGYDLIRPSEHVLNPPYNSWFYRNLISYIIFRCNTRVSFLEILQWSPVCLLILPFEKQFLTFRCLMHVSVSIISIDIHIITANGVAFLPIVGYFILYTIFISFVIHLCIYYFRSYVRWILFDWSIIEMHILLPCI